MDDNDEAPHAVQGLENAVDMELEIFEQALVTLEGEIDGVHTHSGSGNSGYLAGKNCSVHYSLQQVHNDPGWLDLKIHLHKGAGPETKYLFHEHLTPVIERDVNGRPQIMWQPKAMTSYELAKYCADRLKALEGLCNPKVGD
jgi:hypothetical protein